MFYISTAAQQTKQYDAALPPTNFNSATMQVNGVNIHYVTGGTGRPIVLIHGFGENWYVWNRLLPAFSKHFTVIAPDLRGIGESGKPAGGYDKKTMAEDVHQVVKKLGYDSVYIAGHDVGLMVAYAYAAQYPGEVKKMALLDAPLPGVEPYWSENAKKAWWWGFFAWPASAGLVKGKEAYFLAKFWDEQAYVKGCFTTEEKNELIRAYSVPGSFNGAFKWFAAFTQDVKDNNIFNRQKLAMPVLAMGGDHHTGPVIASLVSKVATNVTEANIKDAGHWLVQERTEDVKKILLAFFMGEAVN